MTNNNGGLPILTLRGVCPGGADYPHLFRLLHWVLWPSLVILVLTGLSQHAISSPDWSLFGGVLPPLFWPGRVHFWHTWAALFFAPSVLTVLWVYLRNRPRSRPCHLILLVGGTAMVVSGLVVSAWVGPPAVYQTARWIHFVLGFIVLPITFLWHAVEGLTRYRRALVRAFHPWARPRWRQLVYFAPIALVTTCLVLSGLPAHPSWRDLVAGKIDTADVETKDLHTLPWDDAEPVAIELFNGFGFDGGRTRVTLWALHDGNELFVKARWRDPAEDRRNMPWARTAEGWKRLVTNPDDERHYYEDKFSLLFPIEPDWQFEQFGCAVHCHAGGGREYGYKASAKLVDVWHWKSTRTDPCGQVDDKYWSKDDRKNKDRGRWGDPKTIGTGYDKNVPKDDTSRPKWLPGDPWKVRQGIIAREDAVEYASEEGKALLAKIPVGAIIPGIVASPAVGDRGDVSCTSKHEDGVWHLYIRRKLDTGGKLDDGRPSDVRFVPGKAYPFGCAAFDHSSKRHAYGLTPYRLVLEK